jgi:hypothetical protein
MPPYSAHRSNFIDASTLLFDSPFALAFIPNPLAYVSDKPAAATFLVSERVAIYRFCIGKLAYFCNQ